MKQISLFLASSITQFHMERLELGNFIRLVNDRLEDQGIQFSLFMCEEADDAMSLTRKQDQYNDQIRKSDWFVLLVQDTIGMYTLEEYEIAQKHCPYLFFFVKGKSPIALENPIHFDHIDQVKWHLLQAINQTYVQAPLEMRDGYAYWNGNIFRNIKSR